MISTQKLPFSPLLLENPVYLIAATQAASVLDTIKHLTVLDMWNTRRYQSGGCHLSLIKAGFVWPAQTGDMRGRPSNAKVRRFRWLRMSPGMSSAHDGDNVTMTTLSDHCGKSTLLQMPRGVYQPVFTNRNRKLKKDHRANWLMRCCCLGELCCGLLRNVS